MKKVTLRIGQTESVCMCFAQMTSAQKYIKKNGGRIVFSKCAEYYVARPGAYKKEGYAYL